MLVLQGLLVLAFVACFGCRAEARLHLESPPRFPRESLFHAPRTRRSVLLALPRCLDSLLPPERHPAPPSRGGGGGGHPARVTGEPSSPRSLRVVVWASPRSRGDDAPPDLNHPETIPGYHTGLANSSRLYYVAILPIPPCEVQWPDTERSTAVPTTRTTPMSKSPSSPSLASSSPTITSNKTKTATISSPHNSHNATEATTETASESADLLRFLPNEALEDDSPPGDVAESTLSRAPGMRDTGPITGGEGVGWGELGGVNLGRGPPEKPKKGILAGHGRPKRPQESDVAMSAAKDAVGKKTLLQVEVSFKDSDNEDDDDDDDDDNADDDDDDDDDDDEEMQNDHKPPSVRRGSNGKEGQKEEVAAGSAGFKSSKENLKNPTGVTVATSHEEPRRRTGEEQEDLELLILELVRGCPITAAPGSAGPGGSHSARRPTPPGHAANSTSGADGRGGATSIGAAAGPSGHGQDGWRDGPAERRDGGWATGDGDGAGGGSGGGSIGTAGAANASRGLDALVRRVEVVGRLLDCFEGIDRRLSHVRGFSRFAAAAKKLLGTFTAKLKEEMVSLYDGIFLMAAGAQNAKPSLEPGKVELLVDEGFSEPIGDGHDPRQQQQQQQQRHPENDNGSANETMVDSGNGDGNGNGSASDGGSNVHSEGDVEAMTPWTRQNQTLRTGTTTLTTLTTSDRAPWQVGHSVGVEAAFGRIPQSREEEPLSNNSSIGNVPGWMTESSGTTTTTTTRGSDEMSNGSPQKLQPWHDSSPSVSLQGALDGFTDDDPLAVPTPAHKARSDGAPCASECPGDGTSGPSGGAPARISTTGRELLDALGMALRDLTRPNGTSPRVASGEAAATVSPSNVARAFVSGLPAEGGAGRPRPEVAGASLGATVISDRDPARSLAGPDLATLGRANASEMFRDVREVKPPSLAEEAEDPLGDGDGNWTNSSHSVVGSQPSSVASSGPQGNAHLPPKILRLGETLERRQPQQPQQPDGNPSGVGFGKPAVGKTSSEGSRNRPSGTQEEGDDNDLSHRQLSDAKSGVGGDQNGTVTAGRFNANDTDGLGNFSSLARAQLEWLRDVSGRAIDRLSTLAARANVTRAEVALVRWWAGAVGRDGPAESSRRGNGTDGTSVSGEERRLAEVTRKILRRLQGLVNSTRRSNATELEVQALREVTAFFRSRIALLPNVTGASAEEWAALANATARLRAASGGSVVLFKRPTGGVAVVEATAKLRWKALVERELAGRAPRADDVFRLGADDCADGKLDSRPGEGVCNPWLEADKTYRVNMFVFDGNSAVAETGWTEPLHTLPLRAPLTGPELRPARRSAAMVAITVTLALLSSALVLAFVASIGIRRREDEEVESP
ncbi:unnamed protein product [Lampetra planeri]